MEKFYTGKNIYQAAKIVSNYKKQGFTFSNMSCRADNLHFWGTHRTKKGNLREVHVFTTVPIKRCRTVNRRLTKDFKTMKKNNYFINGHSWGY